MKRAGVLWSVVALYGLLLAAGAAAQQSGQTSQNTAANQNASGKQSTTETQTVTFSTVRGVLVSTESLLGSNMQNPQGEHVGDIKQLMIDPHSGKVMYAVVGMGGFLGLGEKTVIVPWDALTVARDGKSLVLNVQKPLVPQNAEAGSTDAERAQGHAAAPQGSGGWGAETPYGQLYNATNEQTISGQVNNLETVVPLPGMVPGTQMLVKTDDAQTVRVHMGPKWYLERQEVKLPENAQVQVTGAMAEVEGQQVLLARTVQFNDHSLTLRDATGTPLWSSLHHSAK